MIRRWIASAVCLIGLASLAPAPATAQLVVNDPVNTIQNIAIVAEAARLYQETQRLRRIWDTFSAGVGGGERAAWTIPTTRWRTHGDVEDPFGTYLPLGEAFDLGDPTNAAYLGSVIPLQRYPVDVLAKLPATQRIHLARDYANVLMADGFGRVAVQTTSNGRWNSRRALDALQLLQGDFLQAGDAYNGNIGLLQKALGARLISVQTTDVGNQLLASLLEGALTRQKIARDLDARRINADIYRRMQGPVVTRDTTAQMDRVLARFLEVTAMTSFNQMRRAVARFVCLTVALTLTATQAHAQVLVFDPVMLVQLVRQLTQGQRQVEQAAAQRLIWQRLARPLPAGFAPRYVIPPTLWSMTRGTDDLDPFGIYPSVRRAIEQGDPTGLQWRRAVIPLQTYPASVLARLTPVQRLHITREYTHPLTSDGLGIMGVHALAYNRDGHLAASRASGRVGALLQTREPGNIALHQSLAATEMLAAREEHLRNVYLAYLVEDAVADLKRIRDAQVRRLHADLFRRSVGAAVSAQTTAQMDDVLARFWRTAR